MKLNRKGVVLGVVGLGVVAALAGGAGVALAATDRADNGSTMPCGDDDERGGAMFGRAMMGQGAAMTAAADYLGLSQDDLRTQMRAGKSLADVAKAQGKSVSGLQDTILAAVKTNLDANTSLTAQQREAMLTQAKEHVDDMVNNTHAAGSGFGQMGGHMGGMGR